MKPLIITIRGFFYFLCAEFLCFIDFVFFSIFLKIGTLNISGKLNISYILLKKSIIQNL